MDAQKDNFIQLGIRLQSDCATSVSSILQGIMYISQQTESDNKT